VRLFSSVIKTLGARVEREHMEHLRAARQLEDQTAQFSQNNDVLNGYAGGLMAAGGEVDFETLVGGGKAKTNGQQTSVGLDDPWSGEGWADSWAMDSAVSWISEGNRFTARN
jgi:SCY1-like protein 2